MTTPHLASRAPLGRVLTAMVTPFRDGDLSLDLDAAQRLATYLVDRWDPLESTCRHASLSIL